MILLASADMQAGLLPEHGGVLAFLRHAGHDLLRPAPPRLTDARLGACFPLLPFANRIDHGRFSSIRGPVDLGGLEPGEPHALHGQGWRAAWQVLSLRTHKAVLGFHHARRGWPWRYAAQLAYVLEPHALVASLSLTNLDDVPMPAGLGLHPIFPRTSGSVLDFSATDRFTDDGSGIAGRHARHRCPPRQPVSALDGIDDCFGGWNGTLRIEGGRHGLALTASPSACCLHVYVPQGRDFFAAEPVTHSPDALNRADASPMQYLGPGHTATLAMRIGVLA